MSEHWIHSYNVSLYECVSEKKPFNHYILKKIVDTTDEFVPNTIIVCYDLKQQQEQKQQEKTSLANIQFSFHFVSFEMSYALYFRSTSSVPLLVWI